MSLPIVEGCRAVIVGGRKPNKGMIVTVITFAGKIKGFVGNDRWIVDKELETKSGETCNHAPESRLKRLPDKEATTTWQAIESEFNEGKGMSNDTRYKHNPATMDRDIKIVEKMKGTYDAETSEYIDALDNVLRFIKWSFLGTDGSLNDDK